MEARASPLNCDASAALAPNPAITAAAKTATAVFHRKFFQIFTVSTPEVVGKTTPTLFFPALRVAASYLSALIHILKLRPLQGALQPSFQHLFFRIEL
jgi:hypothetical protein